MKHTEAKLSILVGNRKICTIMANAGLGLTGVGCRETYTLRYEPGLIVNEDRVKAAMDKVIAESDHNEDEFKILSYEIIEIKEVE